jgi:ribosome-binding factor A
VANERRQYRVGEKIREILATELLRVGDERLTMLNVNMVRVSSDLRIASIYYLPLGDTVTREAAQEALEKHKGHLRHVLGKSLGIQFVPELRFFYDETRTVMEQVEALLHKARK